MNYKALLLIIATTLLPMTIFASHNDHTKILNANGQRLIFLYNALFTDLKTTDPKQTTQKYNEKFNFYCSQLLAGSIQELTSQSNHLREQSNNWRIPTTDKELHLLKFFPLILKGDTAHTKIIEALFSSLNGIDRNKYPEVTSLILPPFLSLKKIQLSTKEKNQNNLIPIAIMYHNALQKIKAHFNEIEFKADKKKSKNNNVGIERKYKNEFVSIYCKALNQNKNEAEAEYLIHFENIMQGAFFNNIFLAIQLLTTLQEEFPNQYTTLDSLKI